ncbi:MAG: methyltransferase domain-containing protein [Deltaproteobacteria bacterium]|nr:methyltransferase domain-containing protein [Deltaproteobacteria bacterium]
MKTLYEYYKTQEVLPTYAGLADEAALLRYMSARESVFRDRLGLPTQLFHGRRVVEFGPDSGENALVFARWGARLVLVEPNPKAHARIQEYFERFGCAASLERIAEADVLGFVDDDGCDFVVAEGFIYTVQPSSAWLAAFRRLLHDDGMFFVNYMERTGGCVELCWKALHAAYCRQTTTTAAAAARRLFTVKWDSISHTRTFESWTMDVLQNPFVRARCFVDAHAFIDDVTAAGFELQSTFPAYEDRARIEWHKTRVDAAERLRRAHAGVRACQVGFLAGTKLVAIDPPAIAAALDSARALALDVDLLIDGDDDDASARVVSTFRSLAAHIREGAFMAQDADAKRDAAAVFDALAQAFDVAAAGDMEALIKLLETDKPLIGAWGTPTHLVVGRVSHRLEERA